MLLYDVIFKKAFGNPEMFTALVSDLLDIQLEIDKVENDKVFVPSVGQVATRFDLFAEDKKNRVIVEVQHAHYSDTYERFVYYQCSAMVETIASSSSYGFPVTVVTLVFFTGKKAPNPNGSGILVHDFEPRDIVDGEVVKGVYRKKHRLIFIFTNSVKMQKTPKNYLEWMRAIDDSLDGEINENDYSNPHINHLFERIKTNQVTPEERADMKDEYNREEMLKESKLETARNFKVLGVSEETIANATGLSLNEVKAL